MVPKMGPQIGQTTPVKPSGTGPAVRRPAAADKEAISFHQVLEGLQQKREVVFSAHARERIEHRNISLDAGDIARIGEAMDKVGAKGSRSSLFLYGEVALLASIANRTIITAVDGNEEEERIFTGIDSAVILK